MTATETYIPADDAPYPALTSSQRSSGWIAERQRTFLEALAEGHGVEVACRRVGLSVASAYAFRRTAHGAAFALGWRAATLIARECVADTLMVRALEGTVDTVVRGDTVITRHRFDNRLALALLRRLDHQVEAAPDPDVKAARLVAQDFDAFLTDIEADAGPARAGLFLARRGGLNDEGDTRDLGPVLSLAAADRLIRTGVSTAGEVAIADLDPARRQHWSAEQWARAEAAGLVALAPPAPAPAPEKTAPEPQHPQHVADDAVWWDEDVAEFRTHFPPPDDFAGDESGDYGDPDYDRELTEPELAAIGQGSAADAAARAAQAVERDLFFGFATAGPAEAALLAPADPPVPDPDAADPVTEAFPAPLTTGADDMTEKKGHGSATAQKANAKAAAEGEKNPRKSSAAQAELGKKGGATKH